MSKFWRRRCPPTVPRSMPLSAMATSVSLFLSRARSTRGVSSPHPLFQRRFFSQLMAGPIIPLLSADPFDWIVLMKISEEQFHCSTGEWWRGLTIWMNAWKLGAETGQQNQDDWPWIHGDLIANSTVKTHTHTHTTASDRRSDLNDRGLPGRRRYPETHQR